jgi:hypothetical protein
MRVPGWQPNRYFRLAAEGGSPLQRHTAPVSPPPQPRMAARPVLPALQLVKYYWPSSPGAGPYKEQDDAPRAIDTPSALSLR